MIGCIIVKTTFHLGSFISLPYLILHSRREHMDTCCGVRNRPRRADDKPAALEQVGRSYLL